MSYYKRNVRMYLQNYQNLFKSANSDLSIFLFSEDSLKIKNAWNKFPGQIFHGTFS